MERTVAREDLNSLRELHSNLAMGWRLTNWVNSKYWEKFNLYITIYASQRLTNWVNSKYNKIPTLSIDKKKKTVNSRPTIYAK